VIGVRWARSGNPRGANPNFGTYRKRLLSWH